MIPVAEIKAYLGIEPGNGADDPALHELSLNALAFVESQTRRYFGAVAEHEEILTGESSRRLWLSEAPVEPPADPDYPTVAPLVTVEERALPGAEPVAVEDFQLRRNGAEAYLVRTLGGVWLRDYEYTVTYWRGYDQLELPGDIRQLVLDLVSVKRSLRGQEALRSETVGGYSYTRFGTTDLDAVMGGWATIHAWRRPVFA
jgi:hypothetical protein